MIKGRPYAYGTLLINKKFDCADGMFKANVYFNQLGEAIIVVRYYDEANFYALELNGKHNTKKVALVKKAEG